MSRDHYKGIPKYTNALLSPDGEIVTLDGASVSATTKSFRWTWSATGDSDTVTIPGGIKMKDTSYTVFAQVEDLPIGGSATILRAPSASKTTTTFLLEGAGSMLVGTTLDIILRDRA